ncbi:tripartite tricarboxylate transporter substrate binding protein [Noviherbaspirillum sp. 1P10PC]|uniref:Bug family tripartite tricarboxylate transporter substrate binding protein n=1 Tax=Noviherbaspirillum sp. 1P10PC TaxID=3132292 RepID=UPI0039A0A4F1
MPLIHIKLNRRKFISFTGAAVLSIIAGMHVNAEADTYPSRGIKFIVPFPPGSGTDTTARLFAKRISEISGQPVTVENKPGGNGFIGVQTVLNAPPDGYTVFIGSNSTLSTNAATFKKLPYDPLTDFSPVSLLMRGPCLIIVPANSPYKTLNDLFADARKRPTELNYGSGSVSYTLYSEWLNELGKIKTTNVPYKGAGDAVNAVTAGLVDFAVVDAGGATELVRAGRVRALAYTGTERLPLIPDVPTSAEAGVANFLAFNWVAATVSAKTPPAIVEKLESYFKQAGTSPEIKEHFARLNTPLLVTGPAELRQYQIDEIARWKRLMVTAKLELQ